MQKGKASADELIALILQGIDEVKGNNINLLDLREIENTVCDYFIICSGTSNTHVNAITGSIQKTVSKAIHDKPWHVEGEDNAEWVLMDYINVVVHIFQKHIREFYDIEELWGDAKITEIESSIDQTLK
ncbi:MAG: ribosome silencing factor [Bacteroidota bacterium]